MNKAEIIGIKRHCIDTDGKGVTTLVAFHGCLLRCRYCLNPQCHSSFDIRREKTPKEVMDILKKDELYFIATNGGVTFGGGEPLLRSDFILELIKLGASKWSITLETSLSVERSHIEKIQPWVSEYIVDVKDMNESIYRSYTGRSNNLMKANLQYLIEQGVADKIICRLPLIPGYNTDRDQVMSERVLLDMGIKRFEKFKYAKSTNPNQVIATCDHQRTNWTLEDIRSLKEQKKALKELIKKRPFTRGIIIDENE